MEVNYKDKNSFDYKPIMTEMNDPSLKSTSKVELSTSFYNISEEDEGDPIEQSNINKNQKESNNLLKSKSDESLHSIRISRSNLIENNNEETLLQYLNDNPEKEREREIKITLKKFLSKKK
ncbi:MAG: hypothetical protein MJ252_04260 [archaeon]|nr:hypothetical protein [archaeon]